MPQLDVRLSGNNRIAVKPSFRVAHTSRVSAIASRNRGLLLGSQLFDNRSAKDCFGETLNTRNECATQNEADGGIVA